LHGRLLHGQRDGGVDIGAVAAGALAQEVDRRVALPVRVELGDHQLATLHRAQILLAPLLDTRMPNLLLGARIVGRIVLDIVGLGDRDVAGDRGGVGAVGVDATGTGSGHPHPGQAVQGAADRAELLVRDEPEANELIRGLAGKGFSDLVRADAQRLAQCADGRPVVGLAGDGINLADQTVFGQHLAIAVENGAAVTGVVVEPDLALVACVVGIVELAEDEAGAPTDVPLSPLVDQWDSDLLGDLADQPALQHDAHRHGERAIGVLYGGLGRGVYAADLRHL